MMNIVIVNTTPVKVEDFNPKKSIVARYGKKQVNNKFYGVYYPYDPEKEKRQKQFEDFYDEQETLF